MGFAADLRGAALGGQPYASWNIFNRHDRHVRDWTWSDGIGGVAPARRFFAFAAEAEMLWTI